MSAGAVRQAKYKVLRRLRRELGDVPRYARPFEAGHSNLIGAAGKAQPLAVSRLRTPPKKWYDTRTFYIGRGPRLIAVSVLFRPAGV